MKSLPAVTQRAGTPRDRTHEGHVVTPNVDVPSADRRVAASGSTASGRRSSEEEPQVRFQCDVVPLLEPPYHRALAMTRTHADAEELLQETMIKAWFGFHSFQQGTNTKARLYRIMINTYINSYRKRQRRQAHYPTEEVADALLTADAQHSPRGLPSAGRSGGRCCRTTRFMWPCGPFRADTRPLNQQRPSCLSALSARGSCPPAWLTSSAVRTERIELKRDQNRHAAALLHRR
jgi:hypothetical protein